MITEDLYAQVLVAPAQDGCTELLAVSGYATASMAHRHLNETGVKVQLIYGMALADGVSLVDDAMFRKLEDGGNFRCHYRVDRPPVHSKVYVWLKNDLPVKAFVGSANYTQAGFFGRHQHEAMADADPVRACNYFRRILRGAMEIAHDDIEQRVTLFSRRATAEGDRDCVLLPLITSQGVPGERSGLNWGQRPEENRHPDQAYIPIPVEIRRRGFFPPRAVQFTVRTDDNFSFIAVTAQDGDKAIHSTEGNHILGQYFRDRLGVPRGNRVTLDDLHAYGRTDVEFCKLDDETYLMEFSP